LNATGPDDAPHADHLSPVEGQADRGFADVGIALVLPLEVGPVERGIATPEMPLQPKHLLLVVSPVAGYLEV
jgi:hypothetical protein